MRQESSTLENDDYEEEFSDDSSSTSDEVALLAARAYLQRKHRVQWDQKEARKAKLLNSLALTRNLSSDSQVISSLTPVTDPNIKQDGIGYFWENPNELRYLRTGRPRLDFEFTDTDGLDFDIIEEVDNHHQLRNKRDDLDENNSDDELSESDFEDEGIFTSFPQSPPVQHERHSQARKRLFQDPMWKARWYKARWGEKASMTGDALREEQRKKRIEALVESIPSELLSSSALNDLTDDEIEDAISTYIIANRKKSLSMRNGYMKKKKLTQLKNNQHNKPFTDPNEEKNPIVTPFTVNPNASEHEITKLLEAKRKRSERAKKAYQTRLDKEALRESVKPSVDSVGLRNQSRVMSSLKSKGMSPSIKEATDRINASITWGKYPDTADIKTILRPQRLSGRKDLLLEVLNKSFGLRGRCIPSIDGSSKDKLQRFYNHATNEDIQNCKKKFATLCSLQELGMFIIYKLEKSIV